MEVPDCAALTPGLPSRPRRWSPKEHSAFGGAESGTTAHRSAGSGPPIPKRLTYFDKRPFQKSPFENVRFLGMAVSQSVTTKSAGFRKPVDKNFALCSQ